METRKVRNLEKEDQVLEYFLFFRQEWLTEVLEIIVRILLSCITQYCAMFYEESTLIVLEHKQFKL